MTQSKYAPAPLKHVDTLGDLSTCLVSNLIIHDANGKEAARITFTDTNGVHKHGYDTEKEIIKRYNAHDDLVAALDAMLAVFSDDCGDSIHHPKYEAIMQAAIAMDKHVHNPAKAETKGE